MNAKRARHAAALALEGLIVVALLLLFFLRVPQVAGRSMEPQLYGGEHVLINTLSYDVRIGQWRVAHLRDVRHGDVVAFVHDTGGDAEIYLKRVIGTPGDVISFDRGSVILNGRRLAESYAIRQDGPTLASRIVGPHELFVLGDNRAESDDSRTFGAIAESDVIGRAALIVWPPGRARPIR